MRYLHSMVRVTDIEASLRFWCDGLGLVEVSRKDYPQGQFTLIFLAAPVDADSVARHSAPALELTFNWGSDARYQSGRSFGHLAYEVDDIYALCQHLDAMGVVINRPPRDGRMAFVRSPDGISVELLQKGDALPPSEIWRDAPNIGAW